MPPLYLTYLNALDVAALALTDDEILDAIEAGLAAQGREETVIEPRMHLVPDPQVNGHFNVLRGAFKAPLDLAGVKVIGDYVDNYREGLPSEMGLLLLMDPHNGVPKAIIDGSHLTDMRTGAVTAIGAKYLARKDAKVLGHIGARGTAYWNVRLLDHLFGFDEIRVHSRRPESRDAFAERLSRDLGKPVRATADWRSCVEGADIVVEASRLAAPEPMLKTEWIKPGAFVVPYGTMSAVELSLTDIMAKIVVDDWGQCKGGPFGALRAHVNAGKLSEATLHAEMGEIVAGLKAGTRERERDHPVLAPRPVALRHRARRRDAGRRRRGSGSAIGCATRDAARRQCPHVRRQPGGAGPLAAPLRMGRRAIRRPAGLCRSCRSGAARDAVVAPGSRPRLHVRLPVRARATGRAGRRGAAAGASSLRRTRRVLDRFRRCGRRTVQRSSPIPSAAASVGRSSTRNRASTPSGTTCCAIAPAGRRRCSGRRSARW